jgi:Acyl-CoA thioester hydrolase/BAAT N-terminal region
VTWRDQSFLKTEPGKSHWATVWLSTSGLALFDPIETLAAKFAVMHNQGCPECDSLQRRRHLRCERGAPTAGASAPPETESPMIVVDRPDALIDQPIALRDFAPRQPASVTATQTYAEATRWQSRATFISDNDGQVDVTRQAPVSGTHEGVAPMGLFWSMDRLPSEALPVPPGAIMLPVPIRLEAEDTDGRRAEITIVRRVAYAALALDHFAVEGRPRGLVNIPLEYFVPVPPSQISRGWAYDPGAVLAASRAARPHARARRGRAGRTAIPGRHGEGRCRGRHRRLARSAGVPR